MQVTGRVEITLTQDDVERLLSAHPTKDAGAVRLGGLSTSLPTRDTGKVRLGGLSPSL